MNETTLQQLIQERLAAYRACIAHRKRCAVCRAHGEDCYRDHYYAHMDQHGCRNPTCREYEEPVHPCPKNALMARRLGLGRAATAAARALGYNSPATYLAARVKRSAHASVS
ncbi:MAG TPA: hypothetical protein VJX92_19260 [Methylomirabilota bacterium]|nr:hypothetical protein [Methylomirabilota bacterium]